MVELSQRVATGITEYVVLLFSLSVHESAHGWMAHRMGDDTARSLGRVTLNPLPHIDPVGTVLLPALQIFTSVPLIGWARPTPVDGRRFRHPSRAHVLVAGAGPASNLLLAVLFTVALWAAVRVGVNPALRNPVFAIIEAGVFMNVVLAVFNLLPLPPLDGSAIAYWGLPTPLANAYRRLVGPWGAWILLALFVSGALSWIIGPLVKLLGALLLYMVR